MHQQLAVGAQHVDQSNIASRHRIPLLGSQLVALQQRLRSDTIFALDRGVPVEIEQELL